jgi:hypothetical protein
MEFHPARKKNEILSLEGKWMGLENLILSEISQAQRDKICIFLSDEEYRPHTNVIIL